MIIIDVIAGACQSARDAKTPAAGILLAGVLNLIIDPVLIFTVGMGFNGAALATVIAQYASAIMLTWFTFKGRGMKNFFEEGVGVTTPFPSFDAGVAWAYAKEVLSVLGRVLNLVAVWFYTGCVTTASEAPCSHIALAAAAVSSSLSSFFLPSSDCTWHARMRLITQHTQKQRPVTRKLTVNEDGEMVTEEVSSKVKGKTKDFIQAATKSVETMFQSGVKDNDDYTSVINQRHFERLNENL